jgi:hypothetical protein
MIEVASREAKSRGLKKSSNFDNPSSAVPGGVPISSTNEGNDSQPQG